MGRIIVTADLTAFLLARIDEDEAVARGASAGPWLLESQMVNPPRPLAVWLRRECQPGDLLVTRGANPADLTHIARHDPARVLSECAAKRAIVDAYNVDDDYVTFGDWTSCSDSCPGAVLWSVFKLLALPYASHPDYDPEWAL
jgi:hypothetical protein